MAKLKTTPEIQIEYVEDGSMKQMILVIADAMSGLSCKQKSQINGHDCYLKQCLNIDSPVYGVQKRLC